MSPLPPAASGPSDAPGGRSVSARRRTGARILAISLVVSALLHVLAFLLFPTFHVVGPPAPDSSPAPGNAPPDGGIEVVGLAEVPGVDVEPLPRPVAPTAPEEAPEEEDAGEEEEVERPEEPVDAAAEDAAAEDGAAGEEDLPSVAERLRTPTTGDARLWRPVDPELTTLTPDERALIAIYLELRNMADSVFAAEERERQAREWVFTDDDGRRWGISPGTIYLGDDSVQVPLLDQLQFTRPRTMESMRRQWELDDISRAAEVARVRDAWDERREAIRARRDAERDEARSREAPPSEPADSSGSGS